MEDQLPVMAGTLARHRMFSDMDYADYMNYMDQMKRPWNPGFTHRNENMLDYKLFFARKLKSIFTEQNRLRQHLVQIADLEWDLKQHYYLYGDEYRSGRLGDRYRHLQSRIQQMQDENSYLQSRTGLRLERYMLAQAALGELRDECCVPMSNVTDLCYDDIDDFDVLRRRTRNNRMVASGLCTPDMLCRAYSTSNSEQVYDRYEDHINALFEIERKRHVEEFVKSRERFLHSEPPRTDSQSLFQKPETSFSTSGEGPDTYLDGSPLTTSRTSNSQSLFPKQETSFCASIKGRDTYLDESPVSASQTSNSFHKFPVETAEAAVQVSPREMASTFSNELSNPTSMESIHYFPDEPVRSSRYAAPNISESVSAEIINACLQTNSSRDRQPMTSTAPPMVKPDAFLESSFRNISETQRYDNLPKELSNGGPNVPMVKPEAILGGLYGNRPNTQPDNRFQNESADSGPNVPLMPPPIVKPEAILGGSSGNTTKTQPDNRFHKESSDSGPNVPLMPPPIVKPEAILGRFSGNTPNAQPDNRFQKESSDGGPSVPMVKPEAILGGFHRNGFTRDISELSLGEYFSNGSASTLKENQSLSQTTPRVVPNQRTSNIFDLLDGDFKENLNKSQREWKEKGRPVPEWADQIVEGIKRNLTERHELSTASHRHAGKNQNEDQDQTDYSSSDSYQVNGSRKRATNRKKSRIPVRKPAKTLVYTSEDKEKVLKNVKMCMIKERQFNIVSEFKRYGKK